LAGLGIHSEGHDLVVVLQANKRAESMASFALFGVPVAGDTLAAFYNAFKTKTAAPQSGRADVHSGILTAARLSRSPAVA
jgi:hypothetical protein